MRHIVRDYDRPVAPVLRAPFMRQSWRDVTFVSWRYERSVLEPMIPPGLVVDEHDGSAWLTLVALRLTGSRLPFTPPVPVLSSFAQTNVCTYVVDPDGVPGIWLFSVDAGRLWITAGARLVFGAPYFLAREDIATGRTGRTVRYVGIRHARRPPAACKLVVEPGEVTEPDERDLWLTHRWHAYTRQAGLLLRHPVSHEPWSLRTANLVSLIETLTVAAGLPAPDGVPIVRYSDGLAEVTLGLPRPVSNKRNISA